MRRFVSACSMVCALAFGGAAHARTPDEAIASILGTYDGAWEMFGRDAKGAIVSLARWTDTITLGAPIRHEPGRVFAKAVDVMHFAGAPPREMSFSEGFAIAPDGQAGGRFYDFGGERTDLVQLSSTTWVFDSAVSERDLRSLGFDPKTVVSARHTTTKHVTVAGGIDTEWITRVTTVQTDGSPAAGAGGPVFQFVSMQGHHTRRPG